MSETSIKAPSRSSSKAESKNYGSETNCKNKLSWIK